MRVLHVDDDADIREIAELALRLDPAFEVLSAASGAEALDRVSDFAPELCLIDVMMPGMDGPSLWLALRDHPLTADVPVIFMTAMAQSHMVDDLMRLGAIGIIAKPFDPMKLAEEVKEQLESPGLSRTAMYQASSVVTR
ncbi:response regulator [Palleronia abyssalis]|uniref:Sporulation initiation phosphotransferase F n=1 Tax=Palleronia abyssalis TaxID=1501240 RepID=A0A2R8C223_9RHOB|nr:response regulator [Palleronia abyssalis]SPJ26376.1 Sporulation initiation phosphotransferase F [Palleronia abyssalis]